MFILTPAVYSILVIKLRFLSIDFNNFTITPKFLILYLEQMLLEELINKGPPPWRSCVQSRNTASGQWVCSGSIYENHSVQFRRIICLLSLFSLGELFVCYPSFSVKDQRMINYNKQILDQQQHNTTAKRNGPVTQVNELVKKK